MYGSCSEKNVKDLIIFSAMRALKFSIKEVNLVPHLCEKQNQFNGFL